ncbi:MAG: hypothetical protein R6V54_15295 [Desulfobacteraceae bacterium]
MMEPGNMTKQMLKYQKTLFQNSFDAMVLVQNQTETLTNTFLEQVPGVTEESKKALKSTMDFNKKNREDFKKGVEDWYAQLDDFFKSQ